MLDSREDADGFCEVIRQRMKEKPTSDLIESCDTISSVVPRDQQAKLEDQRMTELGLWQFVEFRHRPAHAIANDKLFAGQQAREKQVDGLDREMRHVSGDAA